MTWNVGNIAMQRRQQSYLRRLSWSQTHEVCTYQLSFKICKQGWDWMEEWWKTYSNCLIFLVIDFEGAETSIPFWITWLTMELSHETKRYNLKLEASPCNWISVKKVAPNKEVQHWWVPLAASRCESKARRKRSEVGAVTSAISEMSRISLLELTLEIQYFSVEIQ